MGAEAVAAFVAGRAAPDAAGAGAEDAGEPPPEEHAAIAAAATMNSVGRTIAL